MKSRSEQDRDNRAAFAAGFFKGISNPRSLIAAGMYGIGKINGLAEGFFIGASDENRDNYSWWGLHFNALSSSVGVLLCIGCLYGLHDLGEKLSIESKSLKRS